MTLFYLLTIVNVGRGVIRRASQYDVCKDQFWLGPKIGLGFSPISPNNKFVERERKNWPDCRKEITIIGDIEELNGYKMKRLSSA